MAQNHRDPWYYRYQDVMPFHIREILLVASSYDTLILEEHGGLNERLFELRNELELSTPLRVTLARTGSKAMALLRERPFDFVVSMVRLEDMDANAFGRLVKAHDPRMPVALLAFSEAGIAQLSGGVDRTAIDLPFLWTGDIRLLMSMIKLTEDRRNVAHDTEKADVRVVLVVEDDIRHYSSIVSLLYAEIISRAHSLIMDGLDELPRRMVMRARPKILLARNFEEAVAFFERFHEYLLAVVSDMRFPREGTHDPEAGARLVQRIHRERRDVPVMMLSLEPQSAARADDLGVSYADKCSDQLLHGIREFIVRSLGFGEFVFRLPDGKEVARAHDLEEMKEVLRTVPAESLIHHSSHNHFSAWLMARSLLHLARLLRPRRIEEFADVEGLRRHVITVFQQARMHDQTGVIHDFSRDRGKKAPLERLGTGSIGGKARGLAFADAVLGRHELRDAFDELPMRIPRSIAIGTDAFDQFLQENPEVWLGREGDEDAAILERALQARLPEEVDRSLTGLVEEMPGPLAVRSSSLLEDSHAHPFAGIYATFMLPNHHPDPAIRAQQLACAVKAVYASTWSRNARSFLRSTPFAAEEEKMGVLVQEIAGRRYGDRFYPAVSAVARSFNHYPVRYLEPDDGIVLLALGFGHSVVLGRAALQFSPRAPGVLPQFGTPRDFLRYGQKRYFALDMTRTVTDFRKGPEASLSLCTLEDAEQDGTLALVGSVYSEQEDRIRDDLSLPGPRAVTFSNILRWKSIPLAEAIDALLVALEKRMGCPVEVELGVDLPLPGEDGATLYVLQVRPQLIHLPDAPTSMEPVEEHEVLFRTSQSLGHGFIGNIRDIVFVDGAELDRSSTPAAAKQVGRVNEDLRAEGAPYLLVGPGRWGTSDPGLGIPVQWADVTGARVIVETPFEGRSVEPSQGAHFFHNIITARVGYLTCLGTEAAEADAARLDMQWLRGQPARSESRFVRHVRLGSPLRIHLDGVSGSAVILKPKP